MYYSRAYLYQSKVDPSRAFDSEIAVKKFDKAEATRIIFGGNLETINDASIRRAIIVLGDILDAEPTLVESSEEV